MKHIVYLLSLLLVAMYLSMCTDVNEIEGLGTIQEDLVTSFLEKNSEEYSEFLELMYATGVAELLNAYGNYTCFIPNNAAMRAYYAGHGFNSSSDMEAEAKREFVYDHIVSAQNVENVYTSSRFPQARLEIPSMSNRFITISSAVDTIRDKVEIYVNENSPIIILDQKVHNGVIHTISKVLTSAKIQLPGVIEADERFSWFSLALRQTSLENELMEMNNDAYDSIRKIVDPNGTGIVSKYNMLYASPKFCHIEYTALIESDETYKKALSDAGFEPTYEGLKQYAASIYDRLYPNDKGITDISDRRNSFNRFIAYHLLDRGVLRKEFLGDRSLYYTETYIASSWCEYIETLCPNSLVEIKPASVNQRDVPVFNRLRTKRGVSIVAEYCDKRAENGVYHEIDGILTLDGLNDELLTKRIRFDATTLLPEMTTNKLRGNYDKSGAGYGYIVPQGYFKYLTYTPETEMEYWGTKGTTTDMECDELLFFGKYDFSLRLPPVPAGTYEVRFGYTANTQRGVAQIFFDGKPCGIPLDMTKSATHADIGWKSDVDLKTEDAIIENDKMMHNRGFMKGPGAASVNGASPLRDYGGSLRYIAFKGSFSETQAHILRVKSVEDRIDRGFMIDYIEYAPRSIWENEGKD
ncbi:MAG: fasciclin domain-containing protein [Dysgonamonadaceae bacterium]|nr:fasciclin domain-containing protein [Dysgonamonadaceae bacterium]